MSKRIVIALGGNALGNTPDQQLKLVRGTAKVIVDMAKEGYEIIRKPKFNVGDRVRLIKYPDEIAVVKEIIWHEKNRRIFYILDVEGNKKRSNSWYYEDENKFEKINE